MSVYRELIAPSEENRYRLAKELKVDQRKVMDFSLPVNPLGVSKKVKAEMRKYLKDLKHFPDPDCVRLREHLARYHQVTADNIFCTAGSSEALRAVQRSASARKILLLSPYQKAVGEMITSWGHISLEKVALDAHDGYSFNAGAFAEAMNDCDVAVLQNPHFPTGTVMERETIISLAKEAEKRECYLVVDESLNGFIPEKSVADAVNQLPFLVVVRTFSFFNALAGTGVAYAVCHTEVSGNVHEKRMIQPTDLLSQRAAVVALRDKVNISETGKIIKEEKAILEKTMKQLDLSFVPTRANFYLLTVPKGKELRDFLSKRAILSGSGKDFAGLGEEHVIVCVKNRRENAALIRAFKEYLGI